jgi:hypothetical protein
MWRFVVRAGRRWLSRFLAWCLTAEGYEGLRRGSRQAELTLFGFASGILAIVSDLTQLFGPIVFILFAAASSLALATGLFIRVRRGNCRRACRYFPLFAGGALLFGAIIFAQRALNAQETGVIAQVFPDASKIQVAIYTEVQKISTSLANLQERSVVVERKEDAQTQILLSLQAQIDVLVKQSIPRERIIAQIEKLGASPTIKDSEIPAFLELFAQRWGELQAERAEPAPHDAYVLAIRRLAKEDVRLGKNKQALAWLDKALADLDPKAPANILKLRDLLTDQALIHELDLAFDLAGQKYATLRGYGGTDNKFWSNYYGAMAAGAFYRAGLNFGDNESLKRAIDISRSMIDWPLKPDRAENEASTRTSLADGMVELGVRTGDNSLIEEGTAILAETAAFCKGIAASVACGTLLNRLGQALQRRGTRAVWTEAGHRAQTQRLEQSELHLRDALFHAGNDQVEQIHILSSLGRAQAALGDHLGDVGKLDDALVSLRRAQALATATGVDDAYRQLRYQEGALLAVIADHKYPLSQDADANTRRRALLSQAAEAMREGMAAISREKAPLHWATSRIAIGSTLHGIWQAGGDLDTLRAGVALHREGFEAVKPNVSQIQWAGRSIDFAISLSELGRATGDLALLGEARRHLGAAAAAFASEGLQMDEALALENRVVVGMRMVEITRNECELAAALPDLDRALIVRKAIDDQRRVARDEETSRDLRVRLQSAGCPS